MIEFKRQDYRFWGLRVWRREASILYYLALGPWCAILEVGRLGSRPTR